MLKYCDSPAECRECFQSGERQCREGEELSATGAACQLSVASDHVTGVKSPAIHLLRMKLALEFVLLLLLLLLLTARAQWQNLKSEIWFTCFSPPPVECPSASTANVTTMCWDPPGSQCSRRCSLVRAQSARVCFFDPSTANGYMTPTPTHTHLPTHTHTHTVGRRCASDRK